MRPITVPTLVGEGERMVLRNPEAGAEGIVRLPGASRERDRCLFRISKIHSPLNFRSFEDNAVNMETALLERVFYVRDVAREELHSSSTPMFARPPRPVAGHFQQTLGCFSRALSRVARPTAPVELSVYPERYYSGRRLKVYQRARDNVLARGVKHSDSYISTFLKHEKVAEGVKRAVPRVIQPRKPEYNVVLGTYLRPMEHQVYLDIAKVWGGPTVMKGFNAFEQGQLFYDAWTSFRDVVAVGLDASRFDQHVSVDALKFEHSVYALYNKSPELFRLLSWQYRTVGFAQTPTGRLKYCVRGCRCSGDMNTALGNCVIMCAMVYGLCVRLKLMRGGLPRVRLFNNGDDCVIVGERQDVLLFCTHASSYFLGLGFEMKVEPVVSQLEHVVFCQTSPLFDGVSWRMCRDPRITLSKDAYVVRRAQVTNGRLKQHCSAVGSCGMSLCGGLPVLQSYYRHLLREQPIGSRVVISEELLGTGFFMLARGAKAVDSSITTAARVSFAHAFGIQPDLQIALERYYDQLPAGNDVIALENVQNSVGVLV